MAFKIFYKRFILLLAVWCYGWAAFSQKTITDLRADLDKATSVKEKADICYAISLAYSGRLKVDSALFFANKVKEFSLSVNYEPGMGKHYLGVAAALFLRRQKQDVINNVGKAIEIFDKEKNNQFLGIAYRQLGAIYSLVENYSLTTKNYWTAIYYSTLAGDDNTLSREYFELGRNYYFTFDADSAITYYTKALRISEKLNDRHKIFIAAGYLGVLLSSTNDLPAARKYFEYSFSNRVSGGDKVLLRIFLSNYGNCLAFLREFQKADSVIIEFERMNLVFNDEWGKIFLHNLKGIAAYEKRNYQQAYISFLEGYNMLSPGIINYDAKNLIFNLGMTEFELHKYDSAIVHLKRARAILHEIKFIPDEMKANALISESFEKINNPDSALHYFRNYSLLKDSAMSLQKQKTIIEVTTRYETEKKEGEIKILEKEKEANSYLLQLQNQQIEKQKLEDEKKSQQLTLISQQNEINKLDADQKSLSLDNEKKENEKRQAKLIILEQEASYQKLLLAKQAQQKKIIYSAIAIALLLTGYGLYRYIRKKRLQNKQEVLNERLRISRELHDEVGATLSGVVLFSEIAKQKMEEDRAGDAQVYLNHISANSKEMVEKMSDIVWSINPDNDSFERIITKLQSYAFNLCAGKGISLHLDMDDAIRSDYPVMQVKRNLYLLMKEAINNAIKYSGGKNIFLSLKKKGNSITAEIKDDGSGFDTGLSYEGNGLKNMKARAESLEGTLAVESQKGKGTSVRLQFHFHPAGGQKQVV